MNLLLCMCGICVYSFGKETRYRIITNTGFSTKTFFTLVLPLALISVTTMLLNGTTDAKYVTHSISIIMSVFSSYFLIYCFYQVYGNCNIMKLLKYLIIATYIYLLIAMLMFMNYGIDNLFTSIQKINAEANELTLGVRLHTFGASYFTAGVLLGFILVLLSYSLTSRQLNSIKTLFYWISYFMIAFIGMMIARTVIIGVLISAFVFIISFTHNIKSLFKASAVIFLALSFIYFGASSLFSSYGDEMDTLSKFGFEMFYNYQTTGQFSSESTDGMFEMYNIIPDNYKTWLIGDGMWSMKDGSYYQGTDIGYLRNIWYFGIIGLFFVIFYYYKSIKLTFFNNVLSPNNPHLSYLLLFIYIIVINFKGASDLIFYTLPFYFTDEIIRAK